MPKIQFCFSNYYPFFFDMLYFHLPVHEWHRHHVFNVVFNCKRNRLANLRKKVSSSDKATQFQWLYTHRYTEREKKLLKI